MKSRINSTVLVLTILCLSASNAALAAHNHKFKKSFWKPQYYFVAQNTHNCDFFYGLVQDNPFIGRASVQFAFPNGCDCHGVAQVTHFPLGGPSAGQRGYINASCTDGRSIKGNFITTSLTTGDGTATDSLGNNYQFTFGHTASNLFRQ